MASIGDVKSEMPTPQNFMAQVTSINEITQTLRKNREALEAQLAILFGGKVYYNLPDETSSDSEYQSVSVRTVYNQLEDAVADLRTENAAYNYLVSIVQKELAC